MMIQWKQNNSDGSVSVGATPNGMPVLMDGIAPVLIEDLIPGDKFTWTKDDRNYKVVLKSTTRVRISLELDTDKTAAEVEKEILNVLPGSRVVVKEVKKKVK